MKTTTKFLAAMVMLALLASTAQAAVSAWTSIYEGVKYATGTKTSPRLMRAYALRIDLQNPNVSFYATPSNGGSPYETTLQTTPTSDPPMGLRLPSMPTSSHQAAPIQTSRDCLSPTALRYLLIKPPVRHS